MMIAVLGSKNSQRYQIATVYIFEKSIACQTKTKTSNSPDTIHPTLPKSSPKMILLHLTILIITDDLGNLG